MSSMAFFSSTIADYMPKNKIQESDAYKELLEKSFTYSYIDATVKIVLGILLIMAGIKLLKYQSKGVKLSNIWAIIRMIWGIGFICFTYSTTLELQQLLLASNPEMSSVMQASSTIGLVVGIVLLCVYPIISLILLNRPNVRKSLR